MMTDVSMNLIGTQVDRPFCPRCHLPMQFSHIEPALEGKHEHYLYRCTCGEVLGKVAVGQPEPKN